MSAGGQWPHLRLLVDGGASLEFTVDQGAAVAQLHVVRRAVGVAAEGVHEAGTVSLLSLLAHAHSQCGEGGGKP